MYAATRRGVDVGLRTDGSVFTPGAAIWKLEQTDDLFVLRKIEERTFGEFCTRRLVLAAYDAMATGSFTSPLDPPAGHGARHPNRS